MESFEDELDAALEMANEAAADDRYAAAAELLGPYVRHRPEHSYAWYLFGNALRRIGLSDEAERALLRAWELEANTDAEPWWYIAVRLGQLYRHSGRLDDAELWFGRATDHAEGGQHGWVWILRGSALARLGQLARAEECHRRALTLEDVDRDEAYLNLGLIFRARGQYAEAVGALTRALELTPDYPAAQEALRSIDGIQDAVAVAQRLADRVP